MKIDTQSKWFRVMIFVILFAGSFAWRKFKPDNKNPVEQLIEAYGESLDIQCSSLLLREAIALETVRGWEADALAKTPEFAAKLEKAAPFFLFSDKETHEKIFQEIHKAGEVKSQESILAITPKLKQILSERKNSYYDNCVNTHAKIWSECKTKSEDTASTQKCFEEKSVAPATVEKLTAEIVPRT